MHMQRPTLVMLFFFTGLIWSEMMQGQVGLHGKVYDSTGVFPLEAVTVLLNSGRGTLTDKNGYYEILAREEDSVWFSYLGKASRKFAVWEYRDQRQLDIALNVGIQVLKEVRLKPPDHRRDSIQNRQDYAKVFHYQKPSLKSIVTSISLTGITVDIDELIRAFQKKKIRKALSFQKRLKKDEEDQFIDRRFSRQMVRQLTGLGGADLEFFMVLYRPDYTLASLASDYDLRKYVLDRYRFFCAR